MSITIHLSEIKGHGWLPTASEDGKEFYRGEFRQTIKDALEHAESVVKRYKEQVKS